MKTNTTMIDLMNAYTDAKAAKDAKEDKQITKVVFLIDHPMNDDVHDSELFAFFPYMKFTTFPNNDTCTSYTHNGQHSPCSLIYAKECKVATPEQYKDLKRELEWLGYNLEITTL